MHARHRSPGNRYRSNSSGMGLGANRMSPDISARGHGFYSSDRSFNDRGFGRGRGRGRGRGQFKSFQEPPQPPPRKGDIWMEAGRLAAEYLVSKGMLPPSALSGKWQSGSLKKQVEDYPDFRQQEDLTQEGRMPAHSRLGSGASDSGLSRRRYNDEFSSRNYVKGRRRGEYYSRHSGSEWGREYGRIASLSDKNRFSPDVEGEDDISSRQYEQPKIGNDYGDAMQKSGSSDLAPEREEAADMGSVQKYNYLDEMGSKAASSSDGQDENGEEPFNISDDLPYGGDVVKGSSDSYKTEKQFNTEHLPIQHNLVEGDHPGKKGSDLLMLCKFANMPTKTRSALTSRVPRPDQFRANEEDNASDTGNIKGPEILVEDVGDDTSRADNVLANTVQDSKCPGSEISEVEFGQPAKDVVESDTAYSAGPGKCLRSQSFPDRVFMRENEKESSGLICFERSSSVKELGEKRPIEFSDLNEEPKKRREWLPSLVNGTGGHLTLSGLSENIVSSQDERASSGKPEILLASDDNFLGNCQFPKTGGEPSVKYAEEKQFLPNSFKICDLNLAGSSDTVDNHHNGPVAMYHSTLTTEKAGTMIDIDFSMSNASMTGEYAGPPNGKAIEIIDLDNDSTLEEKVFENSRRRMETTFNGTEGFSSQGQNNSDVADVQIDNLMLSEFVTNFSNCNSVSEDINPLQNEMGLHNGEATLGDDDSIYMSLGEIPLSFIPDWEQPTAQEYEKPF